MPATRLIAAVEGGGTWFRCAVGRGPNDVVAQVKIPTTTPDETLGRVIDFLRPHQPAAIGVGCFGPIELREDAGDAIGTLLATPKPGWAGVPVRARLADALGVPVAIDTDVNAAALAEQRWGAARGADPVVYVTVGTGIGAGVVVHGKPLHGLMHPELGHIPVPAGTAIDGAPDPFPGSCPFHGRCLEGMAAGSSLIARLGDPAAVPDDDPVWHLEAGYLAFGLVCAILALSPRKIVIGGGVLESRPQLLPRVRDRVRELLGGYVDRRDLSSDAICEYIVAPGMPNPGLAGAFALGAAALP